MCYLSSPSPSSIIIIIIMSSSLSPPFHSGLLLVWILLYEWKIWWWCYLPSPSPSSISISIITSTTIQTGNITRIDMTVCMNVVNIRKWWNCDDEVGSKRFLRFLEPTNYTQLRTRVQSCLNLCPIIFRHASKHLYIKKYSGKRCVQSFPYIVFQNRWPLCLTIKKASESLPNNIL